MGYVALHEDGVVADCGVTLIYLRSMATLIAIREMGKQTAVHGVTGDMSVLRWIGSFCRSRMSLACPAPLPSSFSIVAAVLDVVHSRGLFPTWAQPGCGVRMDDEQ